MVQETPSVWRSSSFLRDGELLARLIPWGRHDQASDVFWHNASQAFLRLIPTTPVPERTPYQLQKLIKEHMLVPFGGAQSWWTERNQYGAIAFDAKEKTQSSADCMSQVFKNGELWGISKWALGGTSREDIIPSISIEEIFEGTLTNYLKFAQERLQLALPLKFVAGLSAVQGFVLALPPGLLGRHGGHVVEDEIIYQGSIKSYTTHAHTYLCPFFEQIWEACGLERPAKFRELKEHNVV
jgi:hypothetical protein